MEKESEEEREKDVKPVSPPPKTSPPGKCTLKTHDVFFRVHLLLFYSPYK